MNKTTIIIPTYNNFDYSETCIDSIRKFTENGSYQLIVVDNNSTDGTADWLKSQSDIEYILNDENMGFAISCNQGIAKAEAKNDILLLHNDCVVTTNWLNNLKECLYSEPDIGAVGPVNNHQNVDKNFSDFDKMFNLADELNTNGIKDYEQMLKLSSFCMLIKRETVNKIGLLDERFSPVFNEEDDYCYRILEANQKILLSKNTFVYHFGAMSLNINPRKNEYFEDNAKKFEEKWGFNSRYSSNIRNELIAFIDEDKGKPINVLEIGCGCGATLLKIKSEYKNAQIFGIELNENSAGIAAHFADMRNENIENANLSYEKNFFDYIIFADVLEHLCYPEQVLLNMKPYMMDSGKILASIPNVMHYSVISDLLNGNFTYTDAGIIDKTHLRFFTLSEINKMFIKCGFADMVYTYNQMYYEQDKSIVDKLVSISGEDRRVQFQAYQYLVKAKKNNN